MKKLFYPGMGLIFLLSLTLIIGGCGEPGFLKLLGEKKIGVILTSEKGSEAYLENALIGYLQNRAKNIEFIGSYVLGGYMDEASVKEKFHNKLDVDYLLFTDLSGISLSSDIRFREIRNKNEKKKTLAEVVKRCSLALSFKVLDLKKDNQIALSGQTTADIQTISDSFPVGRRKYRRGLLKIDEVEEEHLIKRAMIRAVNRTNLLYE